MKKLIILTCVFCFLTTTNAFAELFDNIENLSPVQKEKLTQIYYNYKTENNELETRIMEYSDKLNKVKSDEEKTPEQLEILTGAYERNLSTLKAQQKELEKKVDSEYQQVFTAEQYKQFKEEQVNVQDAFSNFLKK